MNDFLIRVFRCEIDSVRIKPIADRCTNWPSRLRIDCKVA